MAIRIEHQPAGAAVGMAAYAAGRGKTRQRQQKYALDLWKDERRTQARREERMAGFKYRAALEGRREQATQERFEAGQEATMKRFEAGQGATQDRFEAGQEGMQKRAEESRQQQRDMQIERGLQSGDLVLSPRAKDKIQKARDDYADAVADNKFTDDKLDDIRRQTEDKIRKAKRVGAQLPETPSASDVVGRNVVVFDKDTGQYRKPEKGEQPKYQVIDDKLVPIPATTEETAAADEQKTKQRKRTALENRMTKLKDKLRDEQQEGDEPLKLDHPRLVAIQRDIDEVQGQVDALEAPSGGGGVQRVEVGVGGAEIPPKESALAAPEESAPKKAEAEGPVSKGIGLLTPDELGIPDEPAPEVDWMQDEIDKQDAEKKGTLAHIRPGDISQEDLDLRAGPNAERAEKQRLAKERRAAELAKRQAGVHAKAARKRTGRKGRLGQPQRFSISGPETLIAGQANKKLSPDGKWEWDGTKWIPTGGA